jgi:hypothetical protein
MGAYRGLHLFSYRNRLTVLLLIALSLSMVAMAQPAAKAMTAKTGSTSAANGGRKFVLDVVQSAVALPQTDSQDRLRVLQTAADVALPVAPDLAQKYTREGVRIESELIRTGETPAVSIMANSKVACSAAADFVRALTPESASRAEQSLLGAIGSCPKQTADAARTLLDAALDQRVVAPRALMALMEAPGANAAWVQSRFVKLFDSLPSDANGTRKEATNFASMYATMAAKVGSDSAKAAGVKLLAWLGKLDPGSDRNLAVNIATDAMKQALGDAAYQEALRSDVMVGQIAATAGQPGEVQPEEEESVSVLQAMGENGQDKTESLRDLAPSLRAREAAAHGFATGTNGDRKTADRYFDMAFSAANEVWANRTPQKNAAAVIEEISEAAAQVDAIAALKRAQGLNEPAAQAVSMLAIARVVLGNSQ